MDLTDYPRAIRRRWPLLVSVGIIGTIAAFLLTPGASARVGSHGAYTATAVLLQAPTQGQHQPGNDRTAPSVAAIVTRSPPPRVSA